MNSMNGNSIPPPGAGGAVGGQNGAMGPPPPNNNGGMPPPPSTSNQQTHQSPPTQQTSGANAPPQEGTVENVLKLAAESGDTLAVISMLERGAPFVIDMVSICSCYYLSIVLITLSCAIIAPCWLANSFVNILNELKGTASTRWIIEDPPIGKYVLGVEFCKKSIF